MTLVQVKLELGHRAEFRQKPTKEGFTHDWLVFVRGPQDKPIHHFVDKVVFYLHESFAKPKRVVREPPFQIKESGYAGFTLPIEVYFKNKDEPKKIYFEYDLFLHLEGCPPVNHIRCEKLTFQNPTEEFQKKLTKAGGTIVSQHNVSPHNHGLSAHVSHSSSAQPHAPTNDHQPAPSSNHHTTLQATTALAAPPNSLANYNHRTTDPDSGATKHKAPPPSRPGPTTAPASNDISFTSLFGAPLKPTPQPANKSFHAQPPTAPSVKDLAATHQQPVTNQPASSSHNLSSSKKSSTSAHHQHQTKQPGTLHKPPKPTTVSGSVTAETAPPASSSVTRDELRTSKLPMSNGSGGPTALIPAPSKDLKMGSREPTPKSISSLKAVPSPAHSYLDATDTFPYSPHRTHESTRKNQPSTGGAQPSSLAPKDSKKRAVPLPHNSTPDTAGAVNQNPSAVPPTSKHHKDSRKKRDRDESSRLNDDVSSPTSKRKMAPTPTDHRKSEPTTRDHYTNADTSHDALPHVNHLDLGAVPVPPSPPQLSPVQVEEPDTRSSPTRNGSAEQTTLPDGTGGVNGTSSFSREYVDDLLSLQQDLMSLQDRHLVQRIVDVIVETRKYTISPSTFDFDLCRLEKSTVARIKEILFA